MSAINNMGDMGIFVLIIYIVLIYFYGSRMLSKYNTQKNDTVSLLCWIPVLRLYLLGKFTIHKLVGLLLIIVLFLTGEITYVEDGVEKTIELLPNNISVIISYGYLIVVSILFLILYLKTEKLEEVDSNKYLKQIDTFNQQNAILKSLEKPPTIEDNVNRQVDVDNNQNNKDQGINL